jgi:ABC-2 type transport system ATP-binding protein
MSAVIETINLTKRYGDLVAVNDLSLKVEQGEICGFLGPNGAGKTTTILMLIGLTEPTSGQVLICGFNPSRKPLEVKKRVGYLPENPGFYEDLSARENLRYIARLNGIDETDANQRIVRLLEHVGLTNDADRPVREYSRGMLGLDPDGAVRILELITNLTRERGLTVLLSSHQLYQVQQICRRIGIVVKGRLLVHGEMDQLGSALHKERRWNFLIQVDGGADGLENDLRSLDGVAEIEQRGGAWRLQCTKDVRPEVVSLVTRKGLSLLQLRSEDPTLEEIYLKYFREA